MASTSGMPDHFSPVLLNLAVRNMEIGLEKISHSRTSHESKTVGDRAARFHGLLGKNHCQVLGNRTNDITNAHIWPRNNRENLPLVDLQETDIDNPKNTVCLHGNIECNFDRFFLTFVPLGNDFILKVLDPTMHTLQIRDVTPPVTFPEIDGRPLFFSQRWPWGRLLATHSILSHRKAQKDGNLPEDQPSAAEVSANELMEFSLDEAAQFCLRMILNDPTSQNCIVIRQTLGKQSLFHAPHKTTQIYFDHCEANLSQSNCHWSVQEIILESKEDIGFPPCPCVCAHEMFLAASSSSPMSSSTKIYQNPSSCCLPSSFFCLTKHTRSKKIIGRSLIANHNDTMRVEQIQTCTHEICSVAL